MINDLLEGGNTEGGSSRSSGANKWAKNSEFDVPKKIVVTSFRYLTGDDTTAKPEFRDENGGTYRMVFNDLSMGGVERMLENKYKSFFFNVKNQGVAKGVEYLVTRTHNGKFYEWKFERVDG